MIFNQRTFNSLLEQYINAISDESRNGAAQLIRGEYDWCLHSQMGIFSISDQPEKAKAVAEIIEGTPDRPTHQVVDCGHDFTLIGEYLRK